MPWVVYMCFKLRYHYLREREILRDVVGVACFGHFLQLYYFRLHISVIYTQQQSPRVCLVKRSPAMATPDPLPSPMRPTRT